MQIAALLSDLKSLSAGPPAAALALVNVHKTATDTTSQPASGAQSSSPEPTPNPDLQRARDLITYHYSVKIAHQENGLDAELVQARKEVDTVLRQLDEEQSSERR